MGLKTPHQSHVEKAAIATNVQNVAHSINLSFDRFTVCPEDSETK